MMMTMMTVMMMLIYGDDDDRSPALGLPGDTFLGSLNY